MGEKQGRWDVSAAERWEPYEARVSRTVLRGPGGEVPLGYSLESGMPVPWLPLVGTYHVDDHFGWFFAKDH